MLPNSGHKCVYTLHGQNYVDTPYNNKFGYFSCIHNQPVQKM